MSDRFGKLDSVHIAVVTFAQAGELAAHRAHLGLEFPMLADPERRIYQRFGLGQGSIREVWNPGTLRLYARLLIRGRRLRRPRHNTRQLGGDFVIDTDGRLLAAFRPRSPDDRPSIDDLAAYLN